MYDSEKSLFFLSFIYFRARKRLLCHPEEEREAAPVLGVQVLGQGKTSRCGESPVPVRYLLLLPSRPLCKGPAFRRASRSSLMKHKMAFPAAGREPRLSSHPPCPWVGDPPNKPLERLLQGIFFHAKQPRSVLLAPSPRIRRLQLDNLLFPFLLRNTCGVRY